MTTNHGCEATFSLYSFDKELLIKISDLNQDRLTHEWEVVSLLNRLNDLFC